MSRRVFLVLSIAAAAALVVCAVFLALYGDGSDESIAAVSLSAALSYLFVIARPLAWLAAGTLAAAVVVYLQKVSLRAPARTTCLVLGAAVAAMLAASPALLVVLPTQAQIAFAVVVYVGILVPWVFSVFGALLALGFAGVRAPSSPSVDPLGVDPFADDSLVPTDPSDPEQ